MGSRTLFESLTGYPSASGRLLGPESESDDEPREEDFQAIIARLQVEANRDPAGLAKKFHDAFGVDPDPALLKQKLSESQEIVDRAANQSELLGPASDFSAQEESLRPELLGVPPDFGNRYIAEHVLERYREGFAPIDLDPKQNRFEDDSPLGILGWFVFNGFDALTVPRSHGAEQFGRINGAAQFRRHGTDQFVYKLNEPAGGRTRVALLADFGTGLSHSRFIARQIEVDHYDAAIHLGDVYYTGTVKQYKAYFEEPLDAVLKQGTQLFVIPDNHDGYSGFHAYLDFLGRRLTQGGSYFALETEHVQFIGVDTIWHSDRGRIQDQQVRDWLKARLAAGRAASRANVIMTGHHPYEYKKADFQKLNEDVLSLAEPGAIDLWFWGNTHYCALFDRTPQTPYYGSCIGHAGYPYKTVRKVSSPQGMPEVIFVETGSRYEGSDVRPDRGMNGFCSFEIQPGGVELHYRDWRGHERLIAKFARQANGALRLEETHDRT